METNGAILILGVLISLLSVCAQNSEKSGIGSAAPDERKQLPLLSHLMVERNLTSIRSKLNSYGTSIYYYLNSNSGVLAGSRTPVYISYGFDNGKINFTQLENKTIERAAAEQFKRIKARYGRNPDNVHDKLSADNGLEPKKKLAQSDKASSAPRDVFTPSILIVTDYKISAQSSLGYIDEIAYQLAFWNAVDLRLRSIRPVEVRLRIAGIVIGLGRVITTDTFTHGAKIDDEMVPDNALSGMRSYWAKEKRNNLSGLPPFDIVVTMTDLKISPHILSNPMHPGNFGVADKETICSQDDSVGIVSDQGGFDGYLPALNVITTILGMVDKSNVIACDRIYEPLPQTESNRFHWSECYLKKLSTEYLAESRLNCTDDIEDVPGAPLRNFLPNDIMTDDHQCRKRGHSGVCPLTESSYGMCSQVFCGNLRGPAISQFWECKHPYPAMDGTGCKPGHMCMEGICKCISYDCLTGENPPQQLSNGLPISA